MNLNLDSVTWQQVLPVGSANSQYRHKILSAPAQNVQPGEAFCVGASACLAQSWSIKGGFVEVLALPLRAVVGTSVRRQLAERREEDENILHRGLLGALGDGLRAVLSSAGEAAGCGLALLVGFAKRDPSEDRKDGWSANGASLGAFLGGILQAPVEAACSVANVAIYAVALGFGMLFDAPADLAIALFSGSLYACGALEHSRPHSRVAFA